MPKKSRFNWSKAPHWNIEHVPAHRAVDGTLRAEHWLVLEDGAVICSTQDEDSARLITQSPYMAVALRELLAESDNSDSKLTTGIEWATHALELANVSR